MDIVLAAAKADNLVSISLGLVAGKYHTWKIIHVHNPVIGFLRVHLRNNTINQHRVAVHSRLIYGRKFMLKFFLSGVVVFHISNQIHVLIDHHLIQNVLYKHRSKSPVGERLCYCSCFCPFLRGHGLSVHISKIIPVVDCSKSAITGQ